jgi:ectoine hydroxylase-related dioxygenase (phytanoyl-CoA dioxygenase family)
MLSASECLRYQDEGYAIARGVFSPSELEELRAACDELEATARDFAADAFVGVTFFAIHRKANPFARDIDRAEVVPGQLRRVTYPYAASPTLNAMRTHRRLLDCAASILGPDLVQIVNQVNFNPPGSGVGWGWHQDYRFRKAGIPSLLTDFVQTLLAIDLCSIETGGLRVVPGSHKLGPMKLDLDNENAESYFDASRAVTPVLQPGDVILFNSHLVHGSTGNCSTSQRRVYINGYARATASIGMPVLRAGHALGETSGIMEYEGDHELLPKASKY